MALLRKLVIVGVGLIGGSLALALRRKGLASSVIGVGRSRANLEKALETGIVDRALTVDEPWQAELRDADVVLVATPVAQMPSLFAAMAESLGPHAIVTDAGSTKQDVIAAAREHLSVAFPRFVPAHPVAGTENSGAAAASPALFEGRNVILSGLAETSAEALATIEAMWLACGARIVHLDARAHDRIFAAVSHLPHLLAAAYVADLAVRSDAEALFAHAGTGFRDFTRIAAASPEMWRDITLANRDALAEEIAAYRGALDVIEAAMEQDDGASLLALFQSARDARRAWSLVRDDE